MWVKLDDGFPDHPKVVAVGGDAAWLHVCAMAYCARNLTDGLFAKSLVVRLSDRKNPQRLAQLLVTAGLWHDADDQYEIHDYLVYNPSRAQVLAEREAKAAAGRKGAAARWQTNGSSHDTSDGTRHGKRDGRTMARGAMPPYPYPNPTTGTYINAVVETDRTETDRRPA